ncbi:MAG: sugar phosphate isomerase/epimerase family protein [Bacteroidia bacterium]|nr:sugar phosphate isomerase/epimerase family protein [Bacteroidia bacterium]
MKNYNPLSRRKFISQTAKAGVLFSFAAGFPEISFPHLRREKLPDISVFSKHLQWLDYEGMANFAAEVGFDGIDLTVRPGGHVFPENVKKDLPKAVKAVEKVGLKIKLITTAITAAKEPHTETILKTAADLGVDFYRMGWIAYDPALVLKQNQEQLAAQLKELSELNARTGIKGAYQNHAGDRFGAAIWDLAEVLDPIGSEWLGCQYDIRHATVEGANAWPVTLQRIAPHINTLDFKDFVWEMKADGKFEVKNVPLGEGIVNFDHYLALLQKLKIEAPISLHYEYDLGGAEHGNREIALDRQAVAATMKKDLEFLRKRLSH